MNADAYPARIVLRFVYEIDPGAEAVIREPTARRNPWPLAGGIGVLAIVIVVGAVVFVARGRQYEPQIQGVAATVEQTTNVRMAATQQRTVRPYEGLGTWLDAFDFSPAYDTSLDMGPTLDEMAAAGVKTIFVQSGRLDSRSPDVLEDRWVLADLLLHAHQRNIDVVAWFLPMWTDEAADLAHLVAAHEFTVLGERFDGVAVDIEWNQDGLEPEERSDRLVRLSTAFGAVSGDDPVGAIVMPPVLLDVINPQFWPDFPWSAIADEYEVWLPMSYWSFRSNESGYGGGYEYNFESTERLRSNLNDNAALVHGIGGIGGTSGERDFSSGEPIAAIDDLGLFAQSLADSRSIGGSVYDWMTLDADSRALLEQLFESGVAANLPTAGE